MASTPMNRAARLRAQHAERRRQQLETKTQLGLGWQSFPTELLELVFAHCSVPTLLNCSQVCRHWHQAAYQSEIWLALYKQRWPKTTAPPAKILAAHGDWPTAYKKRAIKARASLLSSAASCPISRFTGVCHPVKGLKQQLKAKLVLVVTTKSGESRTFVHGKPIYNDMTMTATWKKNLMDLDLKRPCMIQVLLSTVSDPAALLGDSQCESPRHRTLLLEVRDVSLASLARLPAIGDDRMVKLVSLGGGLHAALWKEGGTPALFHYSVPTKDLVSFSHVNGMQSQLPPLRPNFQNIHLGTDCSVTVVLHGFDDQRVFAQSFAKAQIFGRPKAWIVPLIGDETTFRHQVCDCATCDIPWECAGFKGTFKNCGMLDLVVVDDDSTSVVLETMAVVLQSSSAQTMDYAYSEGERLEFQCVFAAGSLSGALIQEPYSLLLTDLTLTLNV
eukprot:m.38144 g.38144  ORF g.38144 m.38144 type:complete len:445 (+) comp10159_c0_seq2:53-1387(+)